MKDIDFLPAWYKERKRHQSHIRRQYAFLAVTFVAMMGYNLASMHRMARASDDLEQLHGKRLAAESTIQEFTKITTQLNQVRAKADLIGQMDPKIDIAAVLAEMSHVISETVVLSRVEFTAESFDEEDKSEGVKITGVRMAEDKDGRTHGNRLGPVRFRILLGGVAATPADVAALVCRLEDSDYFHNVHASFWKNVKVRTSDATASSPSEPSTGAPSSPAADELEVTQFEIICHLANYEETAKP